MKVKNEREVAQLSPTLCDPMDCSPPGSSVHGVFQARALAWGAIAFSDLTAVGKLKSGWESVAWKPLSHEGTYNTSRSIPACSPSAPWGMAF